MEISPMAFVFGLVVAIHLVVGIGETAEWRVLPEGLAMGVRGCG